MSIFWRVLIINKCWILSKPFSASIEIIIWFLSFNLLTQGITLIDLSILKNPCIPEVNPTWSWCMSFLMCCWILLKFCWGFLYLCSSMILACSFLFLCFLFLVLVSGWWWPHRMSLKVFLPLQFFGKSFRRIGISSSLNVWQNSPVKPSGPGFLF